MGTTGYSDLSALVTAARRTAGTLDGLRAELAKYHRTQAGWSVLNERAENRGTVVSPGEAEHYGENVEAHAHEFARLVSDLFDLLESGPVPRALSTPEPLGGPVPGVNGSHLPEWPEACPECGHKRGDLHKMDCGTGRGHVLFS